MFFFATCFVHVVLKLLLGVSLALDDGYGFDSMLGPPQSLVFTGGDIVVCFAVARVVDHPWRGRWDRAVRTVLLVLLALFLCGNFIVHNYFKVFVNRGLLEFNGAGHTEIVDYALAGITRWSALFGCVALATPVAFALLHERMVRTLWAQHRQLPRAVLGLGIAAMIYAGTFSAGQTGWIRRNPGYELVTSYLTSQAHAIRRATPERAYAFTTPGPLRGSYDSVLDVAVPSQRGKNVLMVLIESLPFEQTPLGGDASGLTVLSELAQNGVTFTNFRTVFPATSRSFLTYHCGIYPGAGAATVTKYSPGYRCDSIVPLLKDAGYRTGFFTAPMFTYDNLHKSRVVGDYDVYKDFLSLHSSAGVSIDAPAVPEEVVSERVLAFTRADRSRPFFANYFMFWNHAPYRLPDEDISSLPPLARYRRTLAYLDRVLRNLIAELEKDGVLNDTVIIVAADHGEGFGLHHENRNHVGHIYEDDVRIPLLVHVPGLGRHVTARSASNVDFAPTLAAMLGLPRGDSWQGQDLLAATYAPRPVLLFGRSSFATNGVVDGHYKYIEYADSGTRLLYDLARDPNEQRDLSARDPEAVKAYHQLIEHWLPVVDYHAWAVHAH